MIIDAPKLSQIPLCRALWKTVFGDSDAFLDRFFSTAFSADRARCITENGDVVAALYWFDCTYGGERVAYIYAVATSPAHRGRGLCTRLMTDTHAHLKRSGYRGVLLSPADDGLFRFYRRFGYETTCYIRKFSVKANGAPLLLRRVDADEYARLRRALLPEGGVLQEGECVAFLAAEAELYTGDGVLLAARRAGDRLFGIELLGDTDKAPRVLAALGVPEGDFRTVGEETPFAMYLPFDGAPPPTYLGHAFD